jgi:hypothetical protein
MEKCEFNWTTCSVTCKKYAMCSYINTQKQISTIQSQLGFLYETLAGVLAGNTQLRNEVEEKLTRYTCELIDMIKHDSELNKGVNYEEN